MKKSILVLCSLCIVLSTQAQQNLKFSNFNDKEHFKLAGDAHIKNGKVQLTPSQNFKRGAIWLKKPIKVTEGFSTTFKFKTSENKGMEGGADGIAFVIQHDPRGRKVGEHGEGIGYAGLANCLAVEFDTYNNDEGSDNHVSVQSNGTWKTTRFNKHSLGISHDVPKMKDETHTAKITYDNKKIKVKIDGKKVLSVDVDIDDLLDLKNGKAFVGFTSATGGDRARHDILSWNFKNDNTSNDDKIVFSKKDDRTSNKLKTTPTNDRQIIKRKTITVKNNIIQLKVWDHNRIDGDIISLSLNGRWIVQNYLLGKRAMTFQIPLSEGQNLLVLHANNLGKVPPNTASIRVIDGKNKSKIVLNSNLEQSEAVVINYEK